ncbi:TATA box binding protein [Yasminevirus sp. GU-2018]|uniref:TATA box binding protein n=1 Tax=Yasminevirus sp. GU-2018 TaxID=2420051 RepID=A0A5K0U9W8_9VIRU|nr:TATA box binding protein [Yasminevirus sp. GU-2018]
MNRSISKIKSTGTFKSGRIPRPMKSTDTAESTPKSEDSKDIDQKGPILIHDSVLHGVVEPIDKEKIDRLRDSIKNILELNDVDIPEDIKVATMTLEGKFDTTFYPWNIYKYIRRSKDGIVDVVKGNSKKKKDNDDDIEVDESGNITEPAQIASQTASQAASTVDVEPASKTKARKGKKSKNRQSEVFLNQVTVSIAVKNKEKPVSVKIFNNGTIHFTGCVSIDNLLEATYKLCIECKREVAVVGTNGKVVDIKFVKDPDVLRVENLYDNKADMINCIFVAPFKIDRPKLQVLMKSDGYNAVYDSNGHAGVKIKYVSTGQKITIFVFESGSIIIILGKQGFRRINEIFTFIYKYLLENYESIVKDDDITTSVIVKYLEEIDNGQHSKTRNTSNDVSHFADGLNPREGQSQIALQSKALAEQEVNDDKDKKKTTNPNDTKSGSGKTKTSTVVQPAKRGRPKINRDFENLIDVAKLEDALNGRRVSGVKSKIAVKASTTTKQAGKVATY